MYEIILGDGRFLLFLSPTDLVLFFLFSFTFTPLFYLPKPLPHSQAPTKVRYCEKIFRQVILHDMIYILYDFLNAGRV